MITIQFKGADRVSDILKDIKGMPEHRVVQNAIAYAGEATVREHLYEKDAQPNKMGAPKTHYYRQAGDSASGSVVNGKITITVKQLGIRQRYYGGVITPKKAKRLTIPLRPEARGKRASEFRNLYIRGKALGRDVGGSFQALYALVARVNQKADKTVLPDNEKMLRSANEAVMNWMESNIG